MNVWNVDDAELKIERLERSYPYGLCREKAFVLIRQGIDSPRNDRAGEWASKSTLQDGLGNVSADKHELSGWKDLQDYLGKEVAS